MKKQNFSSQRQAIYNAICNTKSHPSAKWVYNELKPSYPNLSLGTVYRNIALFKEQGMVISVATVNGEERIDGDLTPHAHYICGKCGKIYDIFDQQITTLAQSLIDEGFDVDSYSVNFFGNCNHCG